MLRVTLRGRPVGPRGMTVRSKQLGMIKRCGLADSAWIGQSVTQKVNQISLVLQCETQKINVGVHVLVFFTKRIEIAATVVELDHLFQGQLAAVVEIRGGQRDRKSVV